MRISLPNKFTGNTRLVLTLLVIFFVHLVYKTMYLDCSGFWYDETFGLYYSLEDWGLIKHISEWDINPPLYYYLLWIWRHFFGISEFAIRFPSVIFSSLAAVMIYLLAIKHFNLLTAVLSLCLFSFSSELYFYAHEARVYSILLFLALSSCYLFFSLQEKNNKIYIVLLGLINFLLIYAHYLTGFILLFEFIFILIFYKEQFSRWIGVSFAVTTALVLWRFTIKTVLVVLNNQKSLGQKANNPGLKEFKSTFSDFFNSQIAFYVIMIMFIISLALITYKWKGEFLKKGNLKKPLFLFLCGFGVILICFSISSKTPFFIKRYMLFSLPFIYLLISYAISKIPNNPLKLGMTALVIIASLSSFTKTNFTTPQPMNYKDAMVFIKKEKSPETAVMVETKDMGALFAYYYDIKIFSSFKGLEAGLNQNQVYLTSGPDDLKNFDFKKYRRVVLTQTFEDMNPDNEALLKTIEANYKNKAVIKNYYGLTVVVYSN